MSGAKEEGGVEGLLGLREDAAGNAKPYGEIYKVTCIVNGKIYVGQTTMGVANRWYDHQSEALAGRGHLLSKAIRKYGVGNFAIETVAQAQNQDALNDLEINLIKTLECRAPRGYNLTEGGSRGKHAPESKAKMSASHTGKRLTPEHIANILKAGVIGTGRAMTEEEKAKISTANLGSVRSLETRAKMSAAKKGVNPSPQAHAAAAIAHHNRQKTPQELEGTRRSNRERVWTPEMREAASTAQQGKKLTPEHIEILRQTHSGSVHTPEHIEKVRQSHLGKKRGPEARAKMKEGRRKAREARAALRTQKEEGGQ